MFTFENIKAFILLLVWFGMLIKWADVLVEWAWSIAKKYWISQLVIGLTIVAFWTSAPEFVVSFLSSMSGASEMAIANVVGSNIANTAFIIWATALVFPLSSPKSTVYKEIPFAILISIVLLLLTLNWHLWVLAWVVLLSFFGIFMFYTYKISKNTWEELVEHEEIKQMKVSKSILFIVLWLIGLVVWWKLIVDNASFIAEKAWLSKEFIWLTIVAIWTSLPELASSIMAALKKNTSMALGWVVWSNIFNILWILWVNSFFWLDWYATLTYDLAFSTGLMIILFLMYFFSKKHSIWKNHWAIMLTLYFSYMWYLIYQI